MYALLLLLACLAAATALNSTISSHGRTCSLNSHSNTPPVCTRDPLFDGRVKGFLADLKQAIKPAAALTTVSSGGSVCAEVYPYVPTQYCACQDDAGGGQVQCKYPVVIGGQLIDTIYVTVVMEVCADPATLAVTMVDADTGYQFSTSITSGESGSIPTGIMIGVPDVGSVQVVLMYKLIGNIDALTVDLGVDLSMTVLGYTETCSGLYPSECPVWFFSQSLNFGSFC